MILKEFATFPSKLRSRINNSWYYEFKPFKLYHIGKEIAAQIILIDIEHQCAGTLPSVLTHVIRTSLWDNYDIIIIIMILLLFLFMDKRIRHRENVRWPRILSYLLVRLELEVTTGSGVHTLLHTLLLELLGFPGNWDM